MKVPLLSGICNAAIRFCRISNSTMLNDGITNAAKHGLLLLILNSSFLILTSCQQNYTPKPHSYFRIDFPEKEYRLLDTIYPFTFEYPVYGALVERTAIVKNEETKSSDPIWLNINFPKYKGTIHLTYLEIDNNFDSFIEENWKIIYKKIAQRADAVDDERVYIDPEQNIYGTLYDISGDAASAVQFFLTDSVKHFLRGSLYFSVKPNQDSLAPAINFFREDIIHLIESVRWKENSLKKN